MRPVAGALMAFRWALVILGGRNPMVVEDTSSMALPSAGLPSLFKTIWALSDAVIMIKIQKVIIIAFIFIVI
jgi:hypothetical protein